MGGTDIGFVVRSMRRYAIGSGVGGVVVYAAATYLLYVGIVAPLEATAFLLLGQAGIVAALVLFILASVARRLPLSNK